MLSVGKLHSSSIVKPNIPYTGTKIKELNYRQKYNKLYKKNPSIQKKLIDRKITPINSPSQ